MAQQSSGRRDEVKDQLRQSTASGAQIANVPGISIMRPAQPNLSGFSQQQSELDNAMGGLQKVLLNQFEEKKDEWITDGKVAYMAGTTEQELMKNGNRFTQLGFIGLKTRNDVNNWFLQENADLESKSASMDPAAYQQYLSEKRSGYLEGLTDPYAKKVAVAAFEEYSPRLAAGQFTQNNKSNLDETENQAYEFLRTGAVTSTTRGQVIPGETSLRISPTPVEPVMELSGRDRDLGIRTLIGEAGNQGEFGMAAVAHNFRNRAVDSRYPKSIAGVVTQKGQYSVWNKGKEGRAASLMAIAEDSPVYQKAAKVFDAVMSGRHVDPTGGALFYHSPSGMRAYAASGVQVSDATRNRTAAAEQDGQSVRIAGHVFYGKSNGLARNVRAMVDDTVEQGDTSGTETAYRDPQVTTAAGDRQREVAAGGPEFPGKAADDLILSDPSVPDKRVSGVKDTGASNEMQEFLDKFSMLPKDRLAKVAARAMAAELDEGSEDLFADGGGIAKLYQLGADPVDIERVQRARERYETNQSKKFNGKRLQFEDDFAKMADDPNVTREQLIETATKAMDDDDLKLDDSKATTLVQQALASRRADESAEESRIRAEDRADGRAEVRRNEAEARKQDEIKNSPEYNPSFQTETGNIYMRMRTGELNGPAAQEEISNLAERYGAKPELVQKLLNEVGREDMSYRTQQLNKLEQAKAKQLESTAGKLEAQQTIAQGFGMDRLTGDVLLEDGTKIGKKEFAIQTVKTNAMLAVNNKVQNKELPDDPEKKAALLASTVHRELQKQHVVDPQAQSQFRSAALGAMVDKDGKVNDSFMKAYSEFKVLKQDGQINSAYIKNLMGDDDTRILFEHVYNLDNGGQDTNSAILSASNAINSPTKDIDQKLLMDDKFFAQRDSKLKETMDDITNVGWARWLDGNYDPQEVLRASTAPIGKAYMQQQIDQLHDTFPNYPSGTIIKMAADNLKANSTVLAGNLIIAPDGKSIRQQMGFDSSLPDSAMGDSVRQYIDTVGPKAWGDMWNKDNANVGRSGIGVNREMPVVISYNPTYGKQNADGSTDGSITIRLIKDAKTGEMYDKPLVVTLKDIGDHYKSEQRKLNPIDHLLQGPFQAAGQVTRDIRRLDKERTEALNAADAGAQIGRMIKPTK